jgi:hypothetical protein
MVQGTWKFYRTYVEGANGVTDGSTAMGALTILILCGKFEVHGAQETGFKLAVHNTMTT